MNDFEKEFPEQIVMVYPTDINIFKIYHKEEFDQPDPEFGGKTRRQMCEELGWSYCEYQKVVKTD